MRQTVLFVDDEQRVLDGLRRSLFTARDRWNVQTACGGEAGLEILRRMPVDVVFSDLRMPLMDGIAFLRRVETEWPEAVRVILSGQEDPESAPLAWQIAHQYLSKPCEGEAVLRALDRAANIHRLLQVPGLRAMVGHVRSLPTTPGVLLRLEQAMKREGSPMGEVIGIIERDAALTSKVLQLVNSAYFGITRSITRVEQALQVMGLDLLRALLIANEIGHAFPCALSSWSPEAELRHTLRVATVAKALGESRAESCDLFTAGVLHDVGKLVLASRAPDLLQRALDRAQDTGEALYVAERAGYGVSHAEVGAYLIGLWGLPWPLVEAVALHHSPERWADAATSLSAKVAFAEMVLNEQGDESDTRRTVSPEVGTMEFPVVSFACLGDAAALQALRARALAAIPLD